MDGEYRGPLRSRQRASGAARRLLYCCRPAGLIRLPAITVPVAPFGRGRTVGHVQWVGRAATMSQTESVQEVLQRLLASQRYAVLATDGAGQPYTSLMAFAVSDDLRQVTLVTERGTHKYANLRANPRVALFIDNRENIGTDTRDAIAVTALGEAEEVDGDEEVRLRNGYLSRHPYLESFAGAASCAVVRVRLRSYLVVRRFEEVLEWRPGD